MNLTYVFTYLTYSRQAISLSQLMAVRPLVTKAGRHAQEPLVTAATFKWQKCGPSKPVQSHQPSHSMECSANEEEFSQSPAFPSLYLLNFSA